LGREVLDSEATVIVQEKRRWEKHPVMEKEGKYPEHVGRELSSPEMHEYS
jgi:hypothetical protein